MLCPFDDGHDNGLQVIEFFLPGVESILSILTLAAVQGTELVIQAEGPDAETAVKALADLFDQEFVDESTSSPTSEHQRDKGSA